MRFSILSVFLVFATLFVCVPCIRGSQVYAKLICQPPWMLRRSLGLREFIIKDLQHFTNIRYSPQKRSTHPHLIIYDATDDFQLGKLSLDGLTRQGCNVKIRRILKQFERDTIPAQGSVSRSTVSSQSSELSSPPTAYTDHSENASSLETNRSVTYVGNNVPIKIQESVPSRRNCDRALKCDLRSQLVILLVYFLLIAH